MSKIFAAAGLAAVMLAGTSVASYAVPTIPISSTLQFGGLTPTNEAKITVGGKANSFDLFAFTPPLKGSTVIDAQVGTSTPQISFNAFDFFTKSVTGTYTVFGPQGEVGKGFGGLAAGFLDFRNFEVGQTYYVGVSASGPNAKSYSGNLAVQSVPLPNSVALFGTAIAGLGLVGAVRRKKSVSTAA